MEKLPISPYKINLSTQSSPVGVKPLFKLKGREVQKQKTLVTLLFTTLFQNQGSEFREQLRMPCKLCLNGAGTHKAPQTPTCSNYCNLHLRLAQTSHASKHQTAGRPQRGRQLALVSRNSTFLRLLTGLVIRRVRIQTCTVVSVVCAHARVPSFLSDRSALH